MYNHVTLVGRLVRDPEKRDVGSKTVLTFTVAVDRNRSDRADFLPIVCWDPPQFLTDNLAKGRLVLVEGRLESRQYETRDGSRRTVYEVRAGRVLLLDRGGQRQKAEEEPPFGEEFDPEDDDQVPF